jgi:transcriptional regulator with XRE-family HTH domain
MSKLADFIKKVREEKKLSQERVADEAGLARSYISKLEDGKFISPSAFVLTKLAKGLGVSKEAIFQTAGYISATEDHNLPPLDVYLRTKYPKLSEQAIQDIELLRKVIEEKYKK